MILMIILLFVIAGLAVFIYIQAKNILESNKACQVSRSMLMKQLEENSSRLASFQKEKENAIIDSKIKAAKRRKKK